MVQQIKTMKELPLSKNGKNKGKYFAQVDDEDYDLLMQWNWSVCKSVDGIFYVRRYDTGSKPYKLISLHRVVLKVADSKMLVDHEDGNGLNNQKSNLRVCTHQQNQRNRRHPQKGTSKYLGVSWKKLENKWDAQIKRGSESRFIGTFKTEIEAAKAYNEAAKKHHGEFANLNFK